MLAAEASVDVRGVDMTDSSHITNNCATTNVRTSRNDICCWISHNQNMARRGIPKDGKVNWYLREWMDMLGVRQRDMIERCDWSKATASQLYSGVQDYSPRLVNEAALALNLAPYELLMKPSEALALRKLRAAGKEIADQSLDDLPPHIGLAVSNG